MGNVPEEQVNEWVEAIAALHANTVRDEDARPAYEAAANILSGYGYQNAPLEVLQMFTNAIEIGYVAALRDIRDGRLDNELEGWRPDLFED
jgi:hypothetical protein